MRRVPPVHLEVELALPAVEREARLLRREAARALDGGEVLREHDAPLQLAPARVAAPREIDRRRPCSRSGSSARAAPRGVASKSASARRASARSRAANSSVRRLRAGAAETKSWGAASSSAPPGDQRGARPCRRRRRGGAAGAPRSARVGVPRVVVVRLGLASSRRRSPRRCRRGSAARSPRRPGRSSGELDAHGEQVALADGTSVSTSTGWPSSRKRLSSTPFQRSSVCSTSRQVGRPRPAAVGLREPETDAAEVQPVRVRPQPFDLGRPPVARDVRVADLAAVAVELVDGGTAPCSSRPGWAQVCQPHCDSVPSGIVYSYASGERLQARHVGRERELAVAHGERRLGVEARAARGGGGRPGPGGRSAQRPSGRPPGRARPRGIPTSAGAPRSRDL